MIPAEKKVVETPLAISQLRHLNLVQLIGWCHDKGEFMVVYEFMPNGSLDSHLFGKKKKMSPLGEINSGRPVTNVTRQRTGYKSWRRELSV